MSSVTAVILETKDYAIFKKKNTNRVVNEKRVKELMEIMKVTPTFFELSPIKCNNENEIWDGQHRLAAAELLGIPVRYYTVNDVNMDQVRQLNDYNSKWSTSDYVHSMITEGNINYKQYKIFQETYGYDLSACLMLLTGRFSHSKIITGIFKSGNLVVTHFDDAVKVASMISQIVAFHKNARNKHFIVAFNKMRTHRNFDFDLFMSKLEMNPKMLLRASTTEMYVESLCDVYNFKTRKNHRIEPHELNFKGNNGK